MLGGPVNDLLQDVTDVLTRTSIILSDNFPVNLVINLCSMIYPTKDHKPDTPPPLSRVKSNGRPLPKTTIHGED